MTFQPKADAVPLNPAELKSGARYELEKALYADDYYIAEGEEILYDGIPNETMKPLNEEARHNVKLFFMANGGKTPSVADMAEAAVAGRPREGSVTVVNAKRVVPLTGGVSAEGMPKPPEKPKTVTHVPKPTQPKFVRPIAQQGNVDPNYPGSGSI